MNVSNLRTLYPEIEPYRIHHVSVGQGHTLYVEECGNPQGIPVIFLHGGPGAACKSYHRSFFNPARYHIILFDQRGSGRSTPVGCLEDNTIWHLINDMETLRAHLQIDQWLLFGGSWGSTLGLLYAQNYPSHVLGLILRSTFLARYTDMQWFYENGGVNRLFPEQWDAFTRLLPEGQHDKPVSAYYHRITSNNAEIARAATLAWINWASCIISFGQATPITEFSETLLNEVRIESHYIAHHCFLEENQILRNARRLANIPCILVHGQRDLVCPLESSYALKRILREVELTILPLAGHLASEPDMIHALVNATDKMAEWLEYILKSNHP